LDGGVWTYANLSRWFWLRELGRHDHTSKTTNHVPPHILNGRLRTCGLFPTRPDYLSDGLR
jgi:hypothetical protein